MRPALATAFGGAILAGAIAASGQPAGDPETGRRVAGMCRTCHGLDGVAKIPIAPHIGGETAGYIARQLLAFRDGSRMHEMMSVVAASLSDEQIADVAAWYAAQTPVATLRADPEDAPEACVACHGADGIATLPEAPNLAGETNIYIETQLKAFRTGKRRHEIMSPIAADLTDADMREVADWYAAVGFTTEPPK